jgi:inhibitor of KinA
MKPEYYKITPNLSEVKWNEDISDNLLQRQIALKTHLNTQFKEDIQEIRIGFKTIGICWKSSVDFEEVQNCINKINELNEFPPLSQKIWQIPVCYEFEYARDLISLAKSKNLEPDELIQLHSSNAYRIHFYGFLPGFMYLQGLAKELHTPRKSVPDKDVPAGSVAIGGSQTGIYPRSSPGGWHLIGQTPIKLFDPSAMPPVWAEPGDSIQFFPISKEEFEIIQTNPEKPIWK